jgi:hypothetical protein
MEVCSQCMNAAAIVHFLWIAGIFLHSLLAGVILYRRAWSQFPLFTAYVLFNLAHSIAGLATYGTWLYFYIYWVGEATAILLGFLVVYEVYKSIFLDHAALRKLAGSIFAVSLTFLIATAVFILANGGQGFPLNISKSVNILEEATRTIEVGLLIVLFSCTGAFGLHWRQSVFGIALGLGIFASVELIAVTMRLQASAAALGSLAVVRALAYTASQIVWVVYILLPERASDESQLPQRGQLEQWNQAVLELIHQ